MLRGLGGLVQWQVQVYPAQEPVSDVLDTGFAEWNLPEEESLDPHQLILARGRGLHGFDLAHHHVGGLGDILRIAGVLDQISATGAPSLQGRAYGVHEPGILAQVDAQAGRIETATQHGVTQLQWVVVGVGAGEREILRQYHHILHATRIGYGNYARVIRGRGR